MREMIKKFWSRDTALPGTRRMAAVLTLWMVAVGAPAAASTYRVDAVGGADGAGCGTVGSPCATIQKAVDQSVSGDLVLVAEGTYVDDVSCDGESAVVCVFQKQVTVLGGFAGGDWSLPNPAVNVTVIDGQDARRGVLVKRGGPGALPATALRMEGFTVRNGRAVGAANGFGGGLKANFSNVTLRDMVFEDNVALGGAGGLAGGGGAALLADQNNVMTHLLERVVFRNNQVTGGGGSGGAGLGGGLIADYSNVSGLSLTFTGNSATGGASTSDGKDGLGGGAAFSFGVQGTLRDVTATGNTATGGSATTTAGAGFGGALFIEGGESPAAVTTDVTLLDSDLSANSALGGDATTAAGGVGGGMMAFGARTTVERTTVLGNLAQGGSGSTKQANAGGGGIFLEWPFSSAAPLHVVRDTIVADNVMSGSQGGGAGIRLLGARADVIHATLVDNRIVGAGFGLGILVGPRISKPSELTLGWSILADHTVPSGGRTVHVQATANTSASSADLSDRNLFVGNSHDTNAGEANSGSFTGFPGSNLLDADPSTFFIDPSTSDYHVDGTVPPSDSATGSSEAVDVDGASRSGDRDLGADEFGALAFPLTVGAIGVGSGTVTSTPAGIDCGADCFESYDEDTVVGLTATPDGGFFFTGWGGDADCADGSVIMSGARECIARFEDTESTPQCSVQQDDLVLSGETVNNTRTESACNSITAGPYTVGLNGNVTFESPRVVLRDGFSVAGSFRVVIGTP